MTPFFYYFFILPLSWLPLAVLYRLSDLLFLLMFYGVGYRKKVIFGNLARSFPHLSDKERGIIARDFYRHFCDLVFESFKGFSISRKELLRRFRFTNPELLDESFEKNQSVLLVGGHYGNWEFLAMGLAPQMRHRMAGIYKPLSSAFFEKKLRQTRPRFGLELVAIKEVPEYFRRETELVREKKTPPFFGVFAIDQSPGDPRKSHWITFLGQDTGVPYGAEKYAREYGLPVFFGIIRKVRRGYYTFDIQKVGEPPYADPKGWILEAGSKFLEDEIRKLPAHWLWSHRRWKHAKPLDEKSAQ